MPEYNDQQSRLEISFRGMRTLCAADCDCGRVHFTSARGHGDYDDGELEELQVKAKEQPSKYIEVTDIDAVHIDGKQIVPDCPCGKYKTYCDWIEAHADELAKYLTEYFKAKRDAARREIESADRHIAGLEPGVAHG